MKKMSSVFLFLLLFIIIFTLPNAYSIHFIDNTRLYINLHTGSSSTNSGPITLRHVGPVQTNLNRSPQFHTLN